MLLPIGAAATHFLRACAGHADDGSHLSYQLYEQIHEASVLIEQNDVLASQILAQAQLVKLVLDFEVVG